MRHKPYEKILNHPADFRVRYCFYTEEEGGRKTIPYQGYRSDFWYDRDNTEPHGQVYMIWPEFEDEHGNLILELGKEVPFEGTARMWVLDNTRRDFHSARINVGQKDYFMEASKKVAKCEVIEVLGLITNPRQ